MAVLSYFVLVSYLSAEINFNLLRDRYHVIIQWIFIVHLPCGKLCVKLLGLKDKWGKACVLEDLG